MSNRCLNLFLPLASTALLLLTSCAQDLPGDSCALTCSGGLDCISTSSGGMCMEPCTNIDELCEDGSICTQGSTDGEGACYIGGSIPEGGECLSNLGCAPGLTCVGSEITGNSCWAPCAPSAGNDDCPASYHCQSYGDPANDQGVCQYQLGALCSLDEGRCEAPLSCDDAYGFCVGECQTDADCLGDQVCRPAFVAVGQDGWSLEEGAMHCYERCSADTFRCDLIGSDACVSADDCEDGDEACASVVGEDHLCLPQWGFHFDP